MNANASKIGTRGRSATDWADGADGTFSEKQQDEERFDYNYAAVRAPSDTSKTSMALRD